MISDGQVTDFAWGVGVPTNVTMTLFGKIVWRRPLTSCHNGNGTNIIDPPAQSDLLPVQHHVTETMIGRKIIALSNIPDRSSIIYGQSHHQLVVRLFSRFARSTKLLINLSDH